MITIEGTKLVTGRDECDRQGLEELAAERIRNTWNSLKFFYYTQSTGFPGDRLSLQDGIKVVSRTKPTNIGLGMVALLAAERNKLLSCSDCERKLKLMIGSLGELPRHEGFFYDWVDAETGSLINTWPENNEPLPEFVSSVDNAWLVLALIAVSEAKPTMAPRIWKDILSGMNFDYFLIPETEDILGGYNVTEGAYTDYCYPRNLLSEPRIVHIANAALQQDQDKRRIALRRLLDREGNVPSQPSGGALFELLMPRLFCHEDYLDGVLGPILSSHLEYGCNNLNGAVGISVGDDPTNEDRYTEMGVGGRYPASTVLTSHGMALWLLVEPERAWETLLRVEKVCPGFFSGIGYRDSVDINTGNATRTQVFVNQAMVFLSMTGYKDPYLPSLFDAYFNQMNRIILSNFVEQD